MCVLLLMTTLKALSTLRLRAELIMPNPRNDVRRKEFPCNFPGCLRCFVNPSGRSSHYTTVHNKKQVSEPQNVISERTPPTSPNRGFRMTHSPQLRAGGGSTGEELNEDFFFGDFTGGGDQDNRNHLGNEPPNTPAPQAPPNATAGPSSHPNSTIRTRTHPHLTGAPCDANGITLPPNAAPPPLEEKPADNFYPYRNRAEFEMADFLFRKEQMSASKIDELLKLQSAYFGLESPFVDHKDMYSVIDATEVGSKTWQCFTVSYTGELPQDQPVPSWMKTEYEVWFRDPDEILSEQLSNPGFANDMDYAPKRVYGENNQRRYQDFMSGNWAWKQAV